MDLFNRHIIDNVLQNLSSKYLTEISEENIASYTEEVIDTIDAEFDSEIYRVTRDYSMLPTKSDEWKLVWLDSSTGYKAQMKEWVRENPVNIQKHEVSLPTSKYAIGISSAIIGIGTIVSVGLFLSDRRLLALTTELASLGLLCYTYKKAKTKEADILRTKMEKVKSELLLQIQSDINQWVDLAEKKIEEIIQSFDTQYGQEA